MLVITVFELRPSQPSSCCARGHVRGAVTIRVAVPVVVLRGHCIVPASSSFVGHPLSVPWPVGVLVAGAAVCGPLLGLHAAVAVGHTVGDGDGVLQRRYEVSARPQCARGVLQSQLQGPAHLGRGPVTCTAWPHRREWQQRDADGAVAERCGGDEGVAASNADGTTFLSFVTVR